MNKSSSMKSRNKSIKRTILLDRVNVDEVPYTYEREYMNYELNQVSPLLELKRYELMQKMHRECQDIINSLGLKIDIVNIIPRWIMLQFANGTYFVDPIFPHDGDNNSQLIKDIVILAPSNKRPTLNIPDIIVALDLKERCNKCINELRDFISTDYYINNIFNVDITVFTTDKFVFYTINGIEFKLHNTVMRKLIRLYSLGGVGDTKKNFDYNIACIMLRYHSLASYNQQLATNPEFYKYLQQYHGVNFELFGSPLNCFFDNYCSLFWDIERNFGSKGTFNNITLNKGIYIANPPYDEEIMKTMVIKLIASLANSQEELSFIIIVPVWDDPNYGTNEANTMLESSKYLVCREKIEKARAKFFNYFTNKYIYPCDIYMFLLQNDKGKEKHNIPLTKIIKKFY
jgi:hypothetical protein